MKIKLEYWNDSQGSVVLYLDKEDNLVIPKETLKRMKKENIDLINLLSRLTREL